MPGPEELRDLSAIERRLTAITSVRQVVNAIWALARAQLPLVERARADAATWLAWVDEVVARLAGPSPARRALPVFRVVLGPERPWCGSLHRQLLDQVPGDGPLGLVGQRLSDALLERPGLAARVRFELPGAVTPEDAEPTARRVAEAALEHAKGHTVELWAPRGREAKLVPVVLLGGERAPVALPPETLTPLPQVLAAAVQASAASWLTVGLVEALYAEVRARAAAAEAARTACDRQLEAVTQAWRVARQEAITSELLELLAGRQAALGGAEEILEK